MYTLRDTTIAITDYSSFITHQSSFDKTTWIYDEASGLLNQKLYADGSSVAYTYSTDGKLAARTWARGPTTIYSYDPDTGELLTVDYSDTTTDIAYTYNRMGQQATVTDAVGTRTFVYTPTFQLESETVTNSPLLGGAGGGYVLMRNYDFLGRSSGMSLDADYEVGYSYDTYGRFNNVGAVLSAATNSFSYSYLPNSDLISGLTVAGVGLSCHSNGQNGATADDPGLSSTRSYEDHRNLLTQIKNEVGAEVISQYDYTNDELGRRTNRTDSGSAFSLGMTNDFGYNTRSELTSALMSTNGYAFEYDNIGNRETSTNNQESLTYTANSLNQYTLIQNGTSETLTYDLDGNLTDDAQWLYTWNAENRLILVEPVKPKKGANKVEFVYDYQGRRIKKTVSTLQRNKWSVSSESTFVYDGWLLIAEYSDTPTPPYSTTNFYTWGLDLSGSLQGAGGIGGLISVTRNDEQGTATYYPCYDANGNITDYVDTNGVVVAHREYDAFGNTIVATGSMVNDFSFWFSTKYLDQETGLYYYGYRYYSPSLGRWLSRDPIGEKGGMNLYAFVLNSPTTQIDPLGMVANYCIMYLSRDDEATYGSRASMSCNYDCCKCTQVKFKQWAELRLIYWLGILLWEDIRPWHPDHDGPYYEEDYSYMPAEGRREAWAEMADRPGYDEGVGEKLISLLQMFETQAICVEGPDAGKTYATWKWSHYFDPPVSERSYYPKGNIEF